MRLAAWRVERRCDRAVRAADASLDFTSTVGVGKREGSLWGLPRDELKGEEEGLEAESGLAGCRRTEDV